MVSGHKNGALVTVPPRDLCQLALRGAMEMRYYTSSLFGVATVVMSLVTMSAASAQTAPVANDRPNQTAVASRTCPGGYVWEPAGYVASGKWRDAHCANGEGHE
jgi:hypothetical protein